MKRLLLSSVLLHSAHTGNKGFTEARFTCPLCYLCALRLSNPVARTTELGPGFCGMILAMPKRASQRTQFEVTCPCCGGLLTIDAENHAVIGHVAAERPKTFGDLDEAARAMHEQ